MTYTAKLSTGCIIQRVASSKADARIEIMKLVGDYEYIVSLELTNVPF